MSAPLPQSNAFDPKALAGLQRLARSAAPADETLRAASKQFESLLLQMMLKSMRDAVPSAGLLDNEQTRMFNGLLDQQLALNIANGKGIGLADVVYRQLRGHGGTDAREQNMPAVAATRSPGAARDFPLDTVVRRPAAGGLIESVAAARQVAAALDSAAGEIRREQPRLLTAADLGGAPNAGGAAASGAPAPGEPSVGAVHDAGSQLTAKARRFVDELWPHALEASRQTGIPARFMIAQAALETGWGEKQLKNAEGVPSYNVFNIKADRRWQGASIGREVMESGAGGTYREAANFRAYASYAEAFADYTRFLSGNPRYAAVIGQQQPEGFARSLQQSGFASDPQYAEKLLRIIGGNTLRRAMPASS